MATFYFNGAVNDEWTELGNWWLDDAHTVAATSLPTSADSVVATSSIGSNTGSEPTLVDFTMNGNCELYISITVTGNATFNGSIYIYYVTITGNATFNVTSYSFSSTITGNAIFNDYSHNGNGTYDSIVTGNATFNDYAYNTDMVTGDATFNDYSYNKYGIEMANIVVDRPRSPNGSSLLGAI